MFGGSRLDAGTWSILGACSQAGVGMLLSVLGQPATFSPLAAAADIDGNGTVTAEDFGLLRARLGTAPGPSELRP